MRLTIVLALLCGLAWLTGPPQAQNKHAYQEEGQQEATKAVGNHQQLCTFALDTTYVAREGSYAILQTNPKNTIGDEMGQLAAVIGVNGRTAIATTGAMTGRVAQGIQVAFGSIESASMMEPGAGLPLLC
jgi:hypothetical protein